MTIFISLTILLFFLYAALLLYYRRAWQQVPPPPPPSEPVTPVTVIIPARNEEAAIGRCLQAVLAQQYPVRLLQVIVADDFSTDGTAAVVRSFAGVELLQLSSHVSSPLNSYKKKAIELAVAQATGQLIVTTDADCTMGPHWLRSIVALYQQQQPVFIAAPVLIESGSRPVEIFQALDFMTLQGITGASVYRRFHTMCNGANMAYERSAFEAVGGYRGIDHIASGDDMLLMHKLYEKWPQRVLFLKSREAIVRTAPVTGIGAFFNQRIRWASKADKYNDRRIFWVLLLVYLFNVLLLAMPVVAIFHNATVPQYPIPQLPASPTLVQYWLLLLLLKTIAELYFLYPVAKFFGRQALLWWFPVAQPFHIVYTVVAGWLGKFGSYRWKGRVVK